MKSHYSINVLLHYHNKLKKLNEKIDIIRGIVLRNKYLSLAEKRNIIQKNLSHLKKRTSLLEHKICKLIDQKIIINEMLEQDAEDKSIDIINIEKLFPVGSIFYTSWGYEQTNSSFYQVVGHTGKKTVLLKKIAAKENKNVGYDTGTALAGYFVPVKDKFIDNKVYKARVGLYNKNKPPVQGNVYLKLSKSPDNFIEGGKSLFPYDETKSSSGVYSSWYA